MDVKTEAIVLQAIDYKDDDKLLTLFSPTLGKITAGIRGVKKPKAKLAFSAQPFCFAEYILAEKGGRYTVTNAYLHESFFSLRIKTVYIRAKGEKTFVQIRVRHRVPAPLFRQDIFRKTKGLRAKGELGFRFFHAAYPCRDFAKLWGK